MEFIIDIKLQLAEFAFMVLLLIDFLRVKRINIKTTKWFKVMLVLVFCYLVSDMMTIYTINKYQDSLLNVVCHRIYYVLMISVVFSFSIYINLAVKIKRKISIKWTIEKIFWIGPYFVCVFGVLTQPFVFTSTGFGAYSDGQAVQILSCAVGYYLFWMLLDTFHYKKYLPKSKISAVRVQDLIWLSCFIVQVFIDKSILISGLAISLSVMILYFSFENPSLYIDERTNNYNSKGFELFFNEECNKFRKKSFNVVVVVIDDLKVLLGTIGVSKYEEIMKRITGRLVACNIRSQYMIYDNAIAFKYGSTREDVEKIGELLKSVLSPNFVVSDTSIKVNTHLLVFNCPDQVNTFVDINELIKMDITGTTDYIRYADNEFFEKKKRTTVLVGMLNDAIENNGFEVVYQPIFSTKDQKFISSEALVRLKDNKTLGFVSPEEFIPVAENNNLIGKIGEIVFSKVCHSIVDLRNRGIRVDYIEVNLSTLQIINDKVTERFLEIMKKFELEPSSLNLEITETAAIESAKLMEKNMNTFREAGCTFSMDDFGTGYSNLSSMTDIPYDIVKLDKSLIWPGFDGNEKAMVMLKNIIQMLKNLGVHIVAEGVETKEMVDFLTENGVDYLQGYYFSKPIPKDKYIEYLKNNQDSLAAN